DDGSKFPLAIRWPKGDEQRPVPVGTFVGAPEEPVNTPDRRAQCFCFKRAFGAKPTGEDVCVGVPADAYAPECARTHHPTEGDFSTCFPLFECQYMEPSGWADCLPGEVHSDVCPTCRCAKPCGAGMPACPDGFECIDNVIREGKVCEPK